jgi:cytochrome c
LLIDAAAHTAASPALYTAAQAASGKAVYATNCASCHGANLQGVAAPAIAGTEFLKTAASNKYTVSILNTIVTQNMPFNNPGSLKPGEYAEVMAYLLASNCYPAGKTAFPTNPPSSFGTAPLAAQAHPAGTPNKLGVCPVK